MGVRQRNYWIRQADAKQRQGIAATAQGVRIGMADSKDYQKGLDELELAKTMEESKRQDSEATWGALIFMGGGKGV